MDQPKPLVFTTKELHLELSEGGIYELRDPDGIKVGFVTPYLPYPAQTRGNALNMALANRYYALLRRIMEATGVSRGGAVMERLLVEDDPHAKEIHRLIMQEAPNMVQLADEGLVPIITPDNRADDELARLHAHNLRLQERVLALEAATPPKGAGDGVAV